jgi:hypothetical protein
MKGYLHKTEQGWVVKHLQTEPKYIGERQSLQGVFIHPHYVALCSHSFYEGKEIQFEILQEANGFLYAHLYKNTKEQQKQLITEIMEEDAKDGLYEDTSHRGNPRPNDVQKLAEEYITTPKQKPEESDGYNGYDVFKAYIDGYNKAKETLYTEKQVKFIVEKSRETGLTAKYLMLSLKQPKK